MIEKNNIVIKISSDTEIFINNYEKIYKNKYGEKITDNYTYRNIPISCYDEFSMLIFMYKHPDVWKTEDKKKDKKTQREIKKYTLNSIITKIENTPKLYYEIEEYTNKTSMDWKSSYFIFSFYLFLNAVNYTPTWIKSTMKFNL